MRNLRQTMLTLLLAGHGLMAFALEAPVIPKFDIEGYEIEGNSLLKAETIEQSLKPFTGKQKDFGDIQRAIEELENLIRAAGYSSVQVILPEQKLERGKVRFKVVELRIGKISVAGNKHFSNENILKSLPSLKVGGLPNAYEISDDLRLANENPVKKHEVLLKTGEKEDTVDVAIAVADEPTRRVFVTLDNTGTRETGISRLGFGFQHANLFDQDHVLTLQYTTSVEKPSKVGIYGFGYRVPLYQRSATVDVFAGYSDVDSGVVSNLFTVSGRGKVFGARYNHYLPRIGVFEHQLTGGLDWRIYENNAALLGGGARLTGDYTVHPVSLTYSGKWAPPKQETTFSASLTRNIPGGSKGRTEDFVASPRAGADANYTVFRYSAGHTHLFNNNWQARAALTGQYAAEPLVSGEAFGIGGASSVRGFKEREIADDTGYSINLEAYTPDFGNDLGMDGLSLRALGFYDFGRVRPHLMTADATGTSVGSMGAGLRAAMGKSLSGKLDYAYVTDGGGGQRNGDWMVHAGLAWVLGF